MISHTFKTSMIPLVAIAVLLTACFKQEPTTTGAGELHISESSKDPYIRYLNEVAGVATERISILKDPVSGDTGYVIEPIISASEKRRGLKGTGIGFKASTLKAMMLAEDAKNLDVLAGTPAEDIVANTPAVENAKGQPSALGKKSHTRWDHWYSVWDVKDLREVHKVKVYIHTVGPARLGPNWTAAVRSAIANWNAQAKGTAMSYVETTNINDHDVSFRGSFGIGNDGTLTSSAFLTADYVVEPDGISLWVNTGYEHSGVPHNQKTTVAMSLLALATNITFTGMEGYYWNNGASVHIPGTPYYDGDGLTPGSSILTYGTSTVSTPVMTAGDLLTFRALYPTHGHTAINFHGIMATGQDFSSFIDYGVIKSHQFMGDTLVYLRGDNRLMQKIGMDGPIVQLWPGTGSSGTASEFLFDKGFYAVRNTAGKIYSRVPGGQWVNQSPTLTVAPTDFRLSGNRLSIKAPIFGVTTLRSHYLVGNQATQPQVERSTSGNVTDWQILGSELYIVEDGGVLARVGFGAWSWIHTSDAGYAHSIQVTPHIAALFYSPDHLNYPSLAVRHGGIYGGWWEYKSDPMYSADDYHVCGDKLAFTQESTYLRIIDYSTWTVHEHYHNQSAGSMVKSVYLTGSTCQFINIITHDNVLRAKYGVEAHENPYIHVLGGALRLPQKTVPIYIP